MVNANLNELELHTGTVAGDPDVEAHFAFPLFWATGNASTAVLCVELEPGKSGPRHVDMPEGFFSSNAVLAIADEVVQPLGSRVIGSPPPEL